MIGEIKIEWLSDTSDCDTCGIEYAEGARVYFDDKIIVECIPRAHCFNGTHYDEGEIYKRILVALGYTLD